MIYQKREEKRNHTAGIKYAPTTKAKNRKTLVNHIPLCIDKQTGLTVQQKGRLLISIIRKNTIKAIPIYKKLQTYKILIFFENLYNKKFFRTRFHCSGAIPNILIIREVFEHLIALVKEGIAS